MQPIRNGGFHNVEDALMQALETAPEIRAFVILPGDAPTTHWW
jgi:hypothetical protein